MSKKIACLVVSHGDIASRFVAASAKIAGKCDDVHYLAEKDYSPSKLREELMTMLHSELSSDGLFIFVSLKGGSYWNCAMRLAKEFPGKVTVFSGLNLSMLLSFITKKHKYSFVELAEVIISDAIRGITKS